MYDLFQSEEHVASTRQHGKKKTGQNLFGTSAVKAGQI